VNWEVWEKAGTALRNAKTVMISLRTIFLLLSSSGGLSVTALASPTVIEGNPDAIGTKPGSRFDTSSVRHSKRGAWD
jgi:hypothetical protein